MNSVIKLVEACILADDTDLDVWAEEVHKAWLKIKDDVSIVGNHLIVMLPKEHPVYHPDSEPGQLAKALVERLKVSAQVPSELAAVPDYYLTSCTVVPSVSLDAAMPDELRIDVSLRGILKDSLS